jgi:hypothetical protein
VLILFGLLKRIWIYVEESIYIREKDADGTYIDTQFETLAWWKFNALKYCILSKGAFGVAIS